MKDGKTVSANSCVIKANKDIKAVTGVPVLISLTATERRLVSMKSRNNEVLTYQGKGEGRLLPLPFPFCLILPVLLVLLWACSHEGIETYATFNPPRDSISAGVHKHLITEHGLLARRSGRILLIILKYISVYLIYIRCICMGQNTLITAK